MSTQKTQTKSDLRTVEVVADYSQEDLTWIADGYRLVPIAATDSSYKITGPSGTKMVLQHDPLNDANKEFLRLTMPQETPFIPFEPIERSIQALKGKKISGSVMQFDKYEVKESHYGNTRFWLIETNIKAPIKGSHVKDDIVGLGFCVRNGYNTNIALGLDPYTMRVVCANGAIGRGSDLGSKTIKHVGNDAKKLLHAFEVAMTEAMNNADKLVKFYESLTQLKMNQKIAESLFRHIHMPDKYFPKYFQITPEKEMKNNPKKIPVTLTNEGKSSTLWEAFNDITQPVWHSMEPRKVTSGKGAEKVETTKAGVNIYSVTRYTQNLHNSMRYIVENKRDFY